MFEDWYGGVDDYTFQVGGYGGFGYDTSHVKPDDAHPAMVIVCRSGDLATMRALLSAAPSGAGRRRLLNASRRWTEVDYRMSGFTKEWEWHDETPLIAACRSAHPEIVESLLREGADPTLEACWADNVSGDALFALKDGLEKLPSEEADVARLLRGEAAPAYMVPAAARDFGTSAAAAAMGLTSHRARLGRCTALVSAVVPLWAKAPYLRPHFDAARASSGFSNAPPSAAALAAAIAAAAPMEAPKEAAIAALTAAVASWRARNPPAPPPVRAAPASARGGAGGGGGGSAGRSAGGGGSAGRSGGGAAGRSGGGAGGGRHAASPAVAARAVGGDSRRTGGGAGGGGSSSRSGGAPAAAVAAVAAPAGDDAYSVDLHEAKQLLNSALGSRAAVSYDCVKEGSMWVATASINGIPQARGEGTKKVDAERAAARNAYIKSLLCRGFGF